MRKSEEWKQALATALERYPKLEELDWLGELQDDVNITGRIIGDILKLQRAEEDPHRRGRRAVPNVSREQLWALFEAYSTEPFFPTLEKLSEGKTMGQVAIKVGLSKMTLYRYRRGEAGPGMEILEQVAKAYNKSPFYFLEYRAMFIGQLIEDALINNPQRSISLLKQVARNGGT
jgi:DNA-binding phage protein